MQDDSNVDCVLGDSSLQRYSDAARVDRDKISHRIRPVIMPACAKSLLHRGEVTGDLALPSGQYGTFAGADVYFTSCTSEHPCGDHTASHQKCSGYGMLPTTARSKLVAQCCQSLTKIASRRGACFLTGVLSS
jgi:hypothetical protein